MAASVGDDVPLHQQCRFPGVSSNTVVLLDQRDKPVSRFSDHRHVEFLRGIGTA